MVREESVSTKLRMVLDASAQTSTNISLNDILYNGPNLQGDLFTILLNFRLFKITLSADIRQMYLRIGIRPEDRCFQQFLYRFNPQEPIAVYQFNRVCFGVKSSPYLALRTVKQLVDDESHHLSEEAKNIASHMLYMDDFVFSVASETEAIAVANELIQLMKLGDFDLIKWTSNSPSVLENIPASHRLNPEVDFDKTLPHKI